MEKKVGDPLSQTEDDLWVEDETTARVGTIIKKVLAPQGTRPVIRVIVGKYTKRINVFISLSRTGRVVVTIVVGLDAAATKKHLLEVRKVNGPGTIRMLWDGSGAHHAASVKQYCTTKDIKLDYFPTHSPETNPVEEINRQLKKFLATQLFWTVQDLKKAVKKFFEERGYHFDLSIEEYICSQACKTITSQEEVQEGSSPHIDPS